MFWGHISNPQASGLATVAFIALACLELIFNLGEHFSKVSESLVEEGLSSFGALPPLRSALRCLPYYRCVLF